jgi:pimeloyl-ACP methyl ester carboxylesterase
MAQLIRYLKAHDGVKLAWATLGNGPALVKAGNWLSHLNYDLESPVWRHWIEFFSDHYRFIRYDERGCGMSQWNVSDLSAERWPEDLASVVEASEPGEKFVLFGLSQGTAAAIAYAAHHPDRVSQLILYGGYATGWAHNPELDGFRRYRAIADLAQLGWGKDNPAFRKSLPNCWPHERRSTSDTCYHSCVHQRSSYTPGMTNWFRSTLANTSPRRSLMPSSCNSTRAITYCLRMSPHGLASKMPYWSLLAAHRAPARTTRCSQHCRFAKSRFSAQ